MTLTEQFLESYKSLESLLRGVYGSGMTVLNYEEQSSEPEKLRICRLVRNFLQHTPDGAAFLTPTDAMCRFLRQESVRIAANAEKAKELSYRQTPVKLGQTLRQAGKLFLKSDRDWLPVIDDKNCLIGVLTRPVLFACLCSAKNPDEKSLSEAIKQKDWTKSLDGYVIQECDAFLSSRELDRVILLRNGKYSGVLDMR